MTPKSGNDSVSLTGPVVGQAGTAGHLPAGYTVREFQIERVLGEGGFSVVYLATDTRLERQVAIKEYMPTALATRNPDLSVHVRSSAQHREAFDAGLRSFINEAKLLARFEHRALVKVHQFWQEKGTAYMVMPYYSGPTLKSWIKQHQDTLDPAWLEQFLRLVMDALETLHKENCLHRDVAPDNILILNERSPLLLDFGAARRVIGDLTQALTVILKPGFAPIEQYAESQSMRQGPWTDVYALCAVAHYMITGRAPTPSVTRVLADDLVPLQTVAAGRFPPAFLAALDAGLTVRPQQRPQSISALRDLMNGIVTPDETLTAPPTRFSAPPAPPPAPAPITVRPMPTLIDPEGEDDKTRIVTTRELPPLRTGSNTISSPKAPAIAPVDADTAPEFTEDPTFESRFPSRSMREHEAHAAKAVETEETDRGWVPLVLGGIAILAVIGIAWFVINWLNDEIIQSRKPKPAVLPPAPVSATAPSNSAPVATAPKPVPVPVPAPAPVVAATPTPSAPVAAEPAPKEPQSAAVAMAQQPAPVVTDKVTHMPAESMTIHATEPPAATKPAPAIASPPKPVAARPAAVPTAAAPTPSAPTKSAPPAHDARMSNSASKAGPASTGETARTRPTGTMQNNSSYETAPPASVPPVTTVDAPVPAPMAALEPSRTATPPSTMAPLRAITRPQAMFPREALRAGVDKGRVIARLYVGADGRVSNVDILSAQPARVFEREVRETAMRWRYEPPGQSRQVDIEFAFDKDR